MIHATTIHGSVIHTNMIRALLALSLLAPMSSAQVLSLQATQHLQAGADAERQRDFETAIAEFRKVTELEPAAPTGFVRMGNAYMENHQYGKAIPALKKALEQNPDLPIAHQLLGYALLTQGYTAEAIPHLEKVGEAGALGIAQIQTGQASDAVSNLQAALVKTPNDPDLLFYLSQASEMLSQQSLDALTAADPNSSRAHQVRAHSYYVSHQFPEAEKEYQQALTLRPDVPGLHLELGEVYGASSQWAKAEEQFLAETRLQPGNAEAAYRLGDSRLQEGKAEEAFKELERADLLRPDMSDTLYSLGKAAVLAGDAAAAQRALTRVIALEKESSLAAQAHYALAGLYRKQGKSQEAEREMQQFHRLQDRNSQQQAPPL
jgi:tetratricopeptide (TPR) repeat protein